MICGHNRLKTSVSLLEIISVIPFTTDLRNELNNQFPNLCSAQTGESDAISDAWPYKTTRNAEWFYSFTHMFTAALALNLITQELAY